MTELAGRGAVRSVPLVPRARVLASAGRRGRDVLGLAGASDWRRASIDAVASLLIGATGTRLLHRGTGARPDWPWPHSSVGDTESALAEHIPGIELLGAIVPRQAGRQRLSLLATSGNELLAIKLGAPGTGIEREVGALHLLERNPLPCIATPLVIADGTLSLPSPDRSPPVTTAFVVTSTVGLRQQRAAIGEPLRTYESDLAERLALLDRPPGTPDDHVPVHGDLTPWNLRHTPRGLALFDWEDAGWGPPGSDIAWYRAACATLPRRRSRRFTT